MSKSFFKNLFKPVADEKERYHQAVPEVYKVPVPAPQEPNVGGSTSARPLTVFPKDTTVYKDSYRNLAISKEYGRKLVRSLPLLYLAVGFKGGDAKEDNVWSLALHIRSDNTGPIYGYVEKLDSHSKGTILNHTFNPDAPFATMIVSISAHITHEYCSFHHSALSSSDPSVQVKHSFTWTRDKGSSYIDALALTRAVESHDCCWAERGGNANGLVLVHQGTGQKLAVYVPAKSHSRMNPVKIAAKIRWFENELWTDEARVAAFLALMTYGELGRRVPVGG